MAAPPPPKLRHTTTRYICLECMAYEYQLCCCDREKRPVRAAPGPDEDDDWLRLLCDSNAEYKSKLYSKWHTVAWWHSPMSRAPNSLVLKRSHKDEHNATNLQVHQDGGADARREKERIIRRAMENSEGIWGLTWYDFDVQHTYKVTDLFQFMDCIASRSTAFYIGVSTEPSMRFAGPPVNRAHVSTTMSKHNDKYSVMSVLVARSPQVISKYEKALISRARCSDHDHKHKCMNKVAGGGHISTLVNVWFLYICYNLANNDLL